MAHAREASTARPAPKKRLRKFLRRFVAFAVALTVAGFYLYARADTHLASNLSQRTVNDITQLNPIQVGRVVTPHSIDEISKLLRDTQGPVSIGGARCSMGGQVASAGSLHIDMRQMNKLLGLDVKARLITVQAGMRWRDIQDAIDPHDLSVMIMQTYANFTVGGALSVNAHGRYMGRGPVVQSVRSIKLVLANGDIVQASPTEHSELFYGAIGGYGGLGVIAEVTLELVPNEHVERVTETMRTPEYAKYFREKISADPKVVFHNADLHPPDFDTLRAVSWVHTDKPLTDTTRLIARNDSYTWSKFFINRSVSIPWGFGLREHVLEPIFYAGDVVTQRNHEASYDIAELEPEDRADLTYVLREYFIPAEQFDAFVPLMRAVFKKHDVQVINVSVRHASADPGTTMAWARGETFAFVVYYVQGTSPQDREAVGVWSREIVDAVLSVGGTYYLPYQILNTPEQFHRAYPRAEELFALKRNVDPTLRFQNTLYEAYGPSPRAELRRELAGAGYQTKPEGQTLLTIPEWYLVFNPVEYADHLAAGKPGDTFPFFASSEEYWSQYKKVLALAHGNYPDNSEYLTMLRVIGVSTTVEYLIKGAYEATVGRIARMTSSGKQSPEDRIIASAHLAYSKLIYDEAWYKFDFLPWAKKIWTDTSVFGPDFLRRTERKLAFSLEFLVKTAYAKLIGFAAQTAYDAPPAKLQLVVHAPNDEALAFDRRIKMLQAWSQERRLIEVPRWGPFSELVPQLAAHGVQIIEVAGNDDIAVSVISKRAHPLPKGVGQHLFDSRVVSDAGRVRTLLFVPVTQLSDVILKLMASGAQIEHVYDY